MHEDRYTRMVRSGVTRRVRDKAALRIDAVELLRTLGPLTSTRIAKTLGTVSRLVSAALREAEAVGEIESYLARSTRGRMDQFWCIAGTAHVSTATRFNAAAVLTAMQAHALQLATGVRV
ncbi:hypothetical protein AB4Y40_30150 [Paraburkholderia sp. EG287B]|uniref:hypothetical protein n=1 Tax=Paraburkholderia sp. EG287B TaxID=3237010 RepID=UPI0034D36A1E